MPCTMPDMSITGCLFWRRELSFFWVVLSGSNGQFRAMRRLSKMIHYVDLALKSIFVENILLAFFLGMCSFLACSKKVETAIGLGFAVVFVLTITTPICWAVKNFLLKKGGLVWAGLPEIDLSFLVFLSFIAVIAAAVQIVEMVVEKVSP